MAEVFAEPIPEQALALIGFYLLSRLKPKTHSFGLYISSLSRRDGFRQRLELMLEFKSGR
jgi:hypothetical protein